MGTEALPFEMSTEVRDLLLHYLDSIQDGFDRAHIPEEDRFVPTLIWSYSSLVEHVPVGPEIGVGGQRHPIDESTFSFMLGRHRLWVDEHTLSLLRGRTLIRQNRKVPAPIHHYRCIWVDPQPDDAGWPGISP